MHTSKRMVEDIAAVECSFASGIQCFTNKVCGIVELNNSRSFFFYLMITFCQKKNGEVFLKRLEMENCIRFAVNVAPNIAMSYRLTRLATKKPLKIHARVRDRLSLEAKLTSSQVLYGYRFSIHVHNGMTEMSRI